MNVEHDMGSEDDFWEQPDVVARFAAREPDHRLVPLIAGMTPGRALDVGCAGGRNTVLLAQHGWDVHAIDSSAGMVAETRRRVAELLGEEAAAERVRQGPMDDLSHYGDASFDLVIGLGIYQNAESLAEWHRALAETARVLKEGGLLLLAHFTPDLDLTGSGVQPVRGEPHVYDGMPRGRGVLFHAPELEAALAEHALRPVAPSETVVVPTEKGQRATVNALLRRVADE
jgi:SAM-dependent methyltransferase